MDNPLLQAESERRRQAARERERKERAADESKRRKRKRRASSQRAASSKSKGLRTLDGQGRNAPRQGNRLGRIQPKYGLGLSSCPYCGGAAPQSNRGHRTRKNASCWACKGRSTRA